MIAGSVRPSFVLPLAVIAVALGGCGSDTASPEPPQWRLVWADEFEGPAGQLPDSANWRFDIGTDWGNAQLEYDTDRPENVSLNGQSQLAITARREAYLGSQYTSGRITTQDLFETTGGRFEARIRLPGGQGIWPAFWLLGANIETVGWPVCGEIDVMEYRGQEPSTTHASVHGPGYSGGQAVTRRFDLAGDRFDTGFHVFAVEWRSGSIQWWVDDTLIQTVTPDDVPGPWVFDHPFYIILNVAVGGTFVGPPDANTSFPQSMLVDWVRVYEEAP